MFYCVVFFVIVFYFCFFFFFFFQAEDGIRDWSVTGVQTCALPISFLDSNAKRKDADDQPFVWGEGDDDIGLFDEIDRESEKRLLAEAQEWRAKRYDAGLGWRSEERRVGEGGRTWWSAYQ